MIEVAEEFQTYVPEDFVEATYWFPLSHEVTQCSECTGWRRSRCPDCHEYTRKHRRLITGPVVEVGSGRRWCYDCGGFGENDEGETCTRCNGGGTERCVTCGGRGEITCETCDGDGTTHKLATLAREFVPTETTTYVTRDVPEKHLRKATGIRTNVETLPTHGEVVRHERETRRIDVLEVVYQYVERGPFSADADRWTVYEIEGALRYDDFPKQTVRRLLPIALIVVVVLILLVVGAVLLL